jgi:hypothetical protein
VRPPSSGRRTSDASIVAGRALLDVAQSAVDANQPEAAEAGRFELRVELTAGYESSGAHGRALASLLLAIHGWLDTQEAETVEVTLDGRTLTLRGRDREAG